ncbi:MAG: threonine--tRNA ligase [Proteobacteria bacterium]|nr:threonine--tRNA ligase [Pseudomonadota bacterium]
MPTITLPDNSQREFEQPLTVMQVSESIGPGLAKATLAGMVDDKLVDSFYLIEKNSTLRIITDRDPEGLEILRHSCAHLMAQAVKELYPEAQVTIGPVIEDGFYYDYAYEPGFTPDDLVKIDNKMQELSKADLEVSRSVKTRDEATKFFRDIGEEYKAQIIESIPQNEVLSLYTQGGFTDLCRGPHVPSTGKIKAFKLMKLAGAYWRGDSNNEMLQRIYGTAWKDKKSLKAYLTRLEEAEKRDHRKLARKQDLFHFQEEAPGMVFWHPKGWAIYKVLEQYISSKLLQHGYQEINTPQIVDRSLWERSGHWEKFRDDMFTTRSENREYAIKPMNCPCHIQVFNQGLRSYRDLPLRLAEFGSCHRNEASGTLHGLMRVRNFTQDDAHIFCTEDQIQDEVSRFIDMLFGVYRDFGFDDIIIKLSTRPENRVGRDETWDKAEKALELALHNKGLEWGLQPGEGAFYGPKIDFSLKDCIGRIWQCGTIQVDFSMPERLGANYVSEDSTKQVPVMLHRAIVGSMERFIGILIENYAGAFPVWLAPIQVVVISITENQSGYAKKISDILRNQGFRVEGDLRNETIGLKIRDHAMQRVPYQIILGAREQNDNTVAVRTRDGEDLGVMSLDSLIQLLNKDIACLGRNQRQLDNK